MDDATTKLLIEKATAVSKETAEAFKRFGHETALLMFAKQMQQNEAYNDMPQNDNTKLSKMIQDAKLKWKYADENAKKKAAQMEKVVLDGQEKIKAIYASGSIK